MFDMCDHSFGVKMIMFPYNLFDLLVFFLYNLLELENCASLNFCLSLVF